MTDVNRRRDSMWAHSRPPHLETGEASMCAGDGEGVGVCRVLGGPEAPTESACVSGFHDNVDPH